MCLGMVGKRAMTGSFSRKILRLRNAIFSGTSYEVYEGEVIV